MLTLGFRIVGYDHDSRDMITIPVTQWSQLSWLTGHSISYLCRVP